MALICPKCGRQYDVTLFEFGHHVICDCGQKVTLKEGNITRQDPGKTDGRQKSDEGAGDHGSED